MRLLTHNMLKSNVRGVEDGYPLAIEAERVEEQEVEFNAEFVVNMLPKLEWGAFVAAAQALGLGDLPSELTEEQKGDEEVQRKVHHALMEVHVMDGFLVCPSTGRKFKINNGIPNMLLHEDELAPASAGNEAETEAGAEADADAEAAGASS